MRVGLAALILCGWAIGCSQEAPTSEEAAPAYSMAPGDFAGEAADAGALNLIERQVEIEAKEAPPAAPDGAGAQPRQPAGPAPVLYLAYSYNMSMQLPAERFDAVMATHVKACQDAGPRLCQLIGSSRSGDPESYMSGFVNLRAEPAWLAGFMAGVARGAEEAGGRITSQTTSTEDLTRAIVDTEANLRAKTTLRDRLQRLLESRPGKLGDLLEVERELARVQAEIDSTQSNLAVMRTRVAMSELSLNYESIARPLRSDTFRPLGEAFANFLGISVGGLAAIVILIAAALPWAILLGLAGWLALFVRKRRGGRFFHRAAPPPAPPTPP